MVLTRPISVTLTYFSRSQVISKWKIAKFKNLLPRNTQNWCKYQVSGFELLFTGKDHLSNCLQLQISCSYYYFSTLTFDFLNETWPAGTLGRVKYTDLLSVTLTYFSRSQLILKSNFSKFQFAISPKPQGLHINGSKCRHNM